MKVLNKKAFFEYEIFEKFEVGIVLCTGEVKSIRQNRVNIADAYISFENPYLVICNMHIAQYDQNFSSKYEPYRSRILLAHKKEINKMIGAINKKGHTIVPLELYFNKKGFAKIKCAIATGKKLHDKRATIKERDWNREKEKLRKYKL